MTQIQDAGDLTSVTDPKQLMIFMARWIARVSDVLRGALDFGENIRASGPSVVALTTTADTVIGHSLGSVPKGYVVISQTGAGSVLVGTTPWSQGTISLRGSAAFTATVLVI